MTKITGHFDGRVVIPNDAARLKPNQTVTIEGEPAAPADPEFGTIAYIVKHMKSRISDEDAELMRRAIDEADRNSVPSPDVNLD